MLFKKGGDRYEGERLMGRRFGHGRYTYVDGEVLERLCPDTLDK